MSCKAEWKRRKDAKVRQALGKDQWPCRQCGATIRYEPRGGNQMQICRVCAPDVKWRSLVQRYGVDKQMFEAMYFEQDGKCLITSCTREARSVDHDHTSGRVRGLVCQGCNVALGFLENSAWMKDAANYLAGDLL